jgi:hypothetical protein
MATAVCDGFSTRRVTVTPEMAREWLLKNENNRPINRCRVELMRQQIEEGKWKITHQGIAFYEDGTVADGQHRLAAIASGEIAVEMMVTWGLSRVLIHAIDSGRPRSITNVLNFMGMNLSQSQVAICRALWQEYHAVRRETVWGNQAFDTGKFAVFCEHVADAMSFSLAPKVCRGLSNAAVSAAIASAWFTQSHVELERFKHLLHTGVGASSEESAAIKLREFLLTSSLTSGGSEARQELFLRTCTALRAFLEGRSLSKLYCRVDSRFPIPECPGI